MRNQPVITHKEPSQTKPMQQTYQLSDMSLPAMVSNPISFDVPKRSIITKGKNLIIKQSLINFFVASLITLAELVPYFHSHPILIILPYIWAVVLFNIKSKETFMVAILLLVAVPVLFLSGRLWQAELFSNLAYLFLIVGAVSAAFELRSNRYDKIKV
jgi:hypothetical protein